MDSNTQQVFVIDFKDLLFVIIKKIGFALVAGFVMAAVSFGYYYTSGNNDAEVLDASVMMDGETDSEYAERIQSINRAAGVINSIESINKQIENQREYLSESILMQIDSKNESVTTAQLIVSVDDNRINGIVNALITSYSQDLLSGDYLSELANELGTKQEYLTELISVKFGAATSVVVNTDECGSADIFTITVIGPNSDYTDSIMDCILEEIDDTYVVLEDTMILHTITLAGRQSFYMVDNNTRDLQYSAANRFDSLQKQIGNYDSSLGEIASKLGVKNKASLYAYFLDNGGDLEGSALGSAIKNSLIWFIVGVIFVVIIVVLNYIWGKKFSTQSKFFGRFPSVYRIGVVKPQNRHSSPHMLVDIITGDDTRMSVEASNKLMAANIKNLTLGMKRVLITGTADINRIEGLIKELGISADVKGNIFDNPDYLEAVSTYDGVILVEQRNYSDCRLIAAELELLANASTKLIGAIII